MSLTTDPSDPRLCKEETGKQCDVYLVLSEEERAKGFVRPVRQKYQHIGKRLKARGEIKPLTAEERLKHPGYVAIDWFDCLGNRAGSYLRQTEVDAIASGRLIDGCGCVTTMAVAIAETYARNPKFYNATWCACCGRHVNLDECVWEDTDQIVGS